MMKCISRIHIFSLISTIFTLWYAIKWFSFNHEISDPIKEYCDIKFKDDLKSRNDRLEHYCNVYSNPFRAESSQVQSRNLSEINSFQYFWFKNRFNMICSIQKAGSNSMHNFLRKVLQAYINEPGAQWSKSVKILSKITENVYLFFQNLINNSL